MAFKSVYVLVATFLLFSTYANASTSPYEIASVVVERSALEGDYLPTPFVMFMGEDFELAKHPSCTSIKIQNNDEVYCVSAQGAESLVGNLGETVGQKDEWLLISVKWLNNVRAQTVNSFGRNQTYLEVLP